MSKRRIEREMNIGCTRCQAEVEHLEAWILQDIKGFTARKLFFANCPQCKQPVVVLYEKRISDDKVFINENIQGINAVKTLYREQKRVITKVYKLKPDNLYGWIYGVNKEIKNKSNDVTQVRQYASDYYGHKKLVKKIMCNKSLSS